MAFHDINRPSYFSFCVLRSRQSWVAGVLLCRQVVVMAIQQRSRSIIALYLCAEHTVLCQCCPLQESTIDGTAQL